MECSAESTQLPPMLVPSPIDRTTSSIASSSTRSQEPAPTNTLLPTAMRPSPERRIGSCRTDLRPKSAKAPLTSKENSLSRARTQNRYDERLVRPPERCSRSTPITATPSYDAARSARSRNSVDDHFAARDLDSGAPLAERRIHCLDYADDF